MQDDAEFLAPRKCMREPVSEILHSAHLLDLAVGAHLLANFAEADRLIRQADMPEVRAWTESLWGAKKDNPEQWRYHRFRPVEGAPPYLPKDERLPVRMPSAEERRRIVEHYGRNCVFCGIPLISKEVQNAMRKAYPEALIWEGTNDRQHAAFQCMWLQYDHLLPHSRGGDNSLENVIVTCAPCNFARWHWTLEEVGLIDPRTVPIPRTSWDGLERFKPRPIDLVCG